MTHNETRPGDDGGLNPAGIGIAGVLGGVVGGAIYGAVVAGGAASEPSSFVFLLVVP